MRKLKLLFVLMFACIILVLSDVDCKASSLDKVYLNKSSVTLYVGKSTNLKVKGTTKKVKWSTSKKSVATVNSKGRVTAKKKGKTKITAKVLNKKYTCTVTVKNPSLSKTKVTLNEGESFTLKLKGTKAKKWSSSDNKVATVNSKGKVLAKKKGKATISCKGSNGKTYKCVVTVKGIVTPTPIPTVKVSPTPILNVGDKDIPPVHVHSYKRVDELKATCEKGGYIKYKCSCGDTYSAEILSLGHDLCLKEVVEATCTSEGYTLNKCKKCDYQEKSDFVKVKPHEYQETERVEPTCMESGSVTSVCKDCEKVYVKHLNELGHDLVLTEYIEQTCKNGESKTEKCSRCTYTEVFYSSVVGPHKYVITSREEPTCVTNGKEYSKCEVCGYELFKAIKTKGHTFSETVVEPEENVNGYSVFTCDVCDYSYIGNYTLPKYLTEWVYEIEEDENTVYLRAYIGNRPGFMVYVPSEMTINGKVYNVKEK